MGSSMAMDSKCMAMETNTRESLSTDFQKAMETTCGVTVPHTRETSSREPATATGCGRMGLKAIKGITCWIGNMVMVFTTGATDTSTRANGCRTYDMAKAPYYSIRRSNMMDIGKGENKWTKSPA